MITKKFSNEQYCIFLRINVEGTIESVDVIGSLYKQLQDIMPQKIHFETLVKEGKIGLISVSINKEKSRSIAHCQIPTSLDFTTTCLLAAKCEQITKIGHTHGVVEVENIAHSHQELEKVISKRAKELEEQFATKSPASKKSLPSNKLPKDTNEGADDNKLVIEMSSNCFSTPECLHYMKKNKSPQIILVEGRSDVKTLSYFGYKNVVSTNGSYMSVLQHQHEKWFKSAQFFACLDGDSSAKKLLTQYKDHFPTVNEVFAPKGKEVSSLTFKQIQRLVKKLKVFELTNNNNTTQQETTNKINQFGSTTHNQLNQNVLEDATSSTNPYSNEQISEKQHFTKHEYIVLENYIAIVKDNSRIVGFDSTMGILFDEPLSKMRHIDYSNCNILLLDGLFENSLYSKVKAVESLYCVIARGFNAEYSNLVTITFKEFEDSSQE
jgi:5S rRNA maturation endonuclease (ribonuclease M5)